MSQITSGTVDVTTGSPTVTAALGVDWGAVSLPALFNVQGDPGVLVYDITAVNAPAPGDRYTLTLGAPYAGASADNVAYAISRDFTPVLGLPLLNPGDVNTAGLFNRAMKKLDGQIVVATGPQGIQGVPGVGFTSVVVVDENTIRITYGDGSQVDVDLPAGPQGIPGTNGLDGVGEQGPQGIPGNDGAGISSITLIDATHIRITYGGGSTVDIEIPLPRGIASVTQPTTDLSLVRVTFTDETTSDLTIPAGPAGERGLAARWQIQANSFDNAPVPVPEFDGQLGLDTVTCNVWQGALPAGTWTNLGNIRGIQGVQGIGWTWSSGAASGAAPATTLNFASNGDVAVSDGTGNWTVIGNLTGPQGAASTVPGPSGNDGVGISSITQPTGTSILVNFTNGGTAGPFELPAGAQGIQGNPGNDSTVQGPQGNTGPDGRGISSVTQPTADTLLVTLTDSSTQGPFTLPTGAAGTNGTNGNDSTVPGPAGVGISSVTQPTADTILVTLTDATTQGPFTLPAGAQGIQGNTGVGIASVTQPTADTILVTLTDASTQGPFTLPAGATGATGGTGGTGAAGRGISSVTQPTSTTLLVTLTDATTQGPFTLPTGGGSSSTDVQVFTSSGTWTKPTGAKRVEIVMIGGGGGGGGGRRGAASTDRSGGGGGCSAPVNLLTVPASALGSTEAVTVGTGGTGGAAVTADSTNGTFGSGGTSSVFGPFTAVGGTGGNNGTTTTGTGASASGMTGYVWATAVSCVAGGAGRNTTGDSVSLQPSSIRPGSGAGGGGIQAANISGTGGTGEPIGNTTFGQLAGGTAGAAGANGGNGGTGRNMFAGSGGGGGGGGNTAGSTPGGTGGTGGTYGGGGGGGGASTNGANSGGGGNGGPGVVIVTTFL